MAQLLKNKFYSLINMAGLTAGPATGILILLWVEDERSFDRFHTHSADICRMELSVVITRKTAKKFFGDEPAPGKVIGTENKDNYTVSGVIADLPLSSSFRFDMLMPTDLMVQKARENTIDLNHDFNSYMFLTFLQLKHGASAAGLPARLNQIHLQNRPEDTDADYLLLP